VQVKSGTIFDNILVTDDVEYAAKFRDETWGDMKDAEKAAFDKIEETKQEEQKAKAAAEAAEREAMGEDDDEEEDEYAEDDEEAEDEEYDHSEL
jgi:calreticulin